MEKKKIHYGWYICNWMSSHHMYNGTSIMAHSNKFLIQVTEELGLSRKRIYSCKSNPSRTGNFYFPMVSSRLAKGDMRKIQCISIIGSHSSRLLLTGSECNSPVYLLCIHWSILVKFCTDSGKCDDDHKLVC